MGADGSGSGRQRNWLAQITESSAGVPKLLLHRLSQRLKGSCVTEGRTLYNQLRRFCLHHAYTQVMQLSGAS